MKKKEMKYLNECLTAINTDDEKFNFYKNKLIEKYDFDVFSKLLETKYAKTNDFNPLETIIALLNDKEINDDTIYTLYNILINDTPDDDWVRYSDTILDFVESNMNILTKHQMLCIAYAIEILYAKGYDCSYEAAKYIYSIIPNEIDMVCSPYDEENIRIVLARQAYSTDNLVKRKKNISMIKKYAIKSNHKHLMGMINYYTGICKMDGYFDKDDEESLNYIFMSNEQYFKLAYIYLKSRFKEIPDFVVIEKN